MDERGAMERALELARRGWGRVHPNPMVGAVVLQGERVVGEGWHAEFGERHAEPAALEAAADAVRGATLVVTLEPCNHQGRQPPCTDAIISAGVRRVVAAIHDPNPVAAGGIVRLRAAGVDVSTGLLETEAARLNAAFLHAASGAQRPWIAVKLATSVDGAIADGSGASRWVSGAEARAWAHWLRAGFDAIAVGSTTALRDDPSLTVRGPLAPRIAPRRVVFDRKLRLPLDCALVESAQQVPVIVVAAPEQEGTSKAAELTAAGASVVYAGSTAEGLKELHSLGLRSLLVEGGAGLATSLATDDLVDRYYWIQSPLFLGADALAAWSLPAVSLQASPRWHVVQRAPLGQDTLLVLDRT
ncbi:MAG TPA: bifunctional diaminohydroxyphosphoribosylaminopyrimidine deaminase/5-amino-6-(5-phosphoribosylamino)uracil reductase RibD [Gemmatimonadales bacterium]|nr:bifunctional diaminohydroxyphosphoribosylaminopyrimidine deaminase/5-amino-6-(5-phosphoribosylamino)uracil reductase RibD [Gemmatimonadales bacterium]